jgi:hypothetical protein
MKTATRLLLFLFVLFTHSFYVYAEPHKLTEEDSIETLQSVDELMAASSAWNALAPLEALLAKQGSLALPKLKSLKIVIGTYLSIGYTNRLKDIGILQQLVKENPQLEVVKVEICPNHTFSFEQLNQLKSLRFEPSTGEAATKHSPPIVSLVVEDEEVFVDIEKDKSFKNIDRLALIVAQTMSTSLFKRIAYEPAPISLEEFLDDKVHGQVLKLFMTTLPENEDTEGEGGLAQFFNLYLPKDVQARFISVNENNNRIRASLDKMLSTKLINELKHNRLTLDIDLRTHWHNEYTPHILKFDSAKKNDRHVASRLSQGEEPEEKNPSCCVCLDQEPNVAFVPCGHLSTCNACSEKLDSCPICREPIKQKLRVFKSQ